MLQDLRFGMRMLLRHRTFTLATIILFALGIGANTAVFSVVNAILLRPLPYPNSNRMVVIWGNFLKLNIEQMRAKAAEYVDYRDQTQSFETVAAFHTADFNFLGSQEPVRITGANVTANLFPMLGPKAAQGRLFSEEETQPGKNNVVVLSHKFWQQRLGSPANIIGQNIRLNDQTYAVVGVMPAGFEFPHPSFTFTTPAEFWTPLVFNMEQLTQRQRPYYLNVIGVLKPTVSLEQSRAEMATLAKRFEQQHPGYVGPNKADGGWRITIVPLQEQIVGKSRRALLILFAAVGLVLLIACANAANLFLMRATARQKELAIRIALGANRVRLIRQLLIESLLVAGLGGLFGLALAWWGVNALLALSPANLPRLQEISLDGHVLLFTLGLTLLTGLIFGIVPAVQTTRVSQQLPLKEGSAAAIRGRHWLRNLLVVGEVSIALLLLIGAGLLLNSFLRLQSTNPGIDADHLLSTEIALPATRYTEPAKVAEFYQELLRKVESLPGVNSASLSTIQPLSGFALNDPFSIEGRPFDPNNATWAGWQRITPNHFHTLGIPFIAGRDFTEYDNPENTEVAIINESLARRYFPGENPLGKRLTLGIPRPDNPWKTIVGVVKDIPHRNLESAAEPDWYLPYFQKPQRDAFLMVRTSATPTGLAVAIRNQVLATDKDQPVTAIKPMNDVIASTTAPHRFNALLLGIFATVALLLAALGIFSVMSYSVTQRTQEIGVRMALGARSSDVTRLIVRQGMTLVIAGIALGIIGSIATARTITSLLYGITALDPVTFTTISLLLAIVALLACYLPARRAAKTDPISALRHE